MLHTHPPQNIPQKPGLEAVRQQKPRGTCANDRIQLLLSGPQFPLRVLSGFFSTDILTNTRGRVSGGLTRLCPHLQLQKEEGSGRRVRIRRMLASGHRAKGPQPALL